MVLFWSQLTKGEPHFTLRLVAVNNVIMIFAFAPIVGLLLGISAITVPWDTLFAIRIDLYFDSRHYRTSNSFHYFQKTSAGKNFRATTLPFTTRFTFRFIANHRFVIWLSRQTNFGSTNDYRFICRPHFNSGAALATVVGVLVEVPVMLSVVKIVNHAKPW